MITSLSKARGVILQWYDEVHVDQYDVTAVSLPLLVNQSADFIAEQCNSENEKERDEAIRVLFADLVEPWNDSFSMRGRNAYAAVFGRICWTACSEHNELSKQLSAFNIKDEEQLRERHARVRANSNAKVPDTCERIVVLSRVTIGADILLTSVLVKRLRQRYPDAEIIITGNKKLYGLFGSMPNVTIESLDYARRGTLTTRLCSWINLCDQIKELSPDLVIAPDSRLDQLGLLPICPESQYLLWENLQLQESTQSLSTLLDQWCCEQLEIDDDQPMYPSLAFSDDIQSIADHLSGLISDRPFIAVKLDYGGNTDKALSRDWEIEILRCMIDRGWRILIDRGFGDEELKNSDAVMRGVGLSAVDVSETDPEHGILLKELSNEDIGNSDIIRFYGSIAAWAACAQQCQLAFSYDSVGHHLAAALEIPLVVAFTGYKDDAFPKAWQPRGAGEINLVCIPMKMKGNRSYLNKILDHIAKLTTKIHKA